MSILALDIGGTKIYGATFTEKQNPIPEKEVKHPTEAQKGAETVFENMLSVINQLKDDKTTAIGVSWAGFLNSDTGKIINSPNIPGFEGKNLKEMLETATNLPVKIENDARCFALAEYFAQPEATTCLLGIILGTGVGSGVIYKGNVLKGANKALGEIGHQRLYSVEAEDLFAGRGIAAFLGQKVSSLDLKNANTYAFVNEKMPERIELFVEWLHNAALAYDPDVMVLGGGISLHFWKYFLPQIQQKLNKSLKKYPLSPLITLSHMKNAGAVGAMLLWSKN